MAKHIPLRKCVGCGAMKEKGQLCRIVKPASGPISVDMAGRQNGRSAYLCRDIACLATARRKKGLERSLKMAVPAEIYAGLEMEIDGGAKNI